MRVKDGELLLTRLGQGNGAFLPIGGTQFRYTSRNGPPEPVPTLELLPLNQEGQFLQVEGTTMKHIPAWMALIEIILTAFVLLSIVSILVYAPFWIIGGISKRRRRPSERQLRLWPLVAVLCIISIVAILILESDDLISRLGNLTWSSVALYVLTIAFAASSLAGAYAVWTARGAVVRHGVYSYSLIATLALLIATAYLVLLACHRAEDLDLIFRNHARPLFAGLAVYAAGRVAVVLVILFLLRRYAHHFHHVVIGRLQRHREFHGHPGFCIHLGIVNGDGRLQVVLVDAVESFLDAHGVAGRPSRFVEPYLAYAAK